MSAAAIHQPTTAERLAAYGITHAAIGSRHDGRRALSRGDAALGFATAFEAIALLDLLDEQQRARAPEQSHWSDCAVNSAPAYRPGECDCGGFPTQTDEARRAFIGSGALAACERLVAWRRAAPACFEPPKALADIIEDAERVVACADEGDGK